MASPSGSVAEIRKSMGSPTNTVLSATGVSEGADPLPLPPVSVGRHEETIAVTTAGKRNARNPVDAFMVCSLTDVSRYLRYSLEGMHCQNSLRQHPLTNITIYGQPNTSILRSLELQRLYCLY